jgi:hypothetical protein
MSGLKLINIIKENKVSSLDELDLRTFLNTVKGDSNALKSVNGTLHGAIDDVLKFAANDKNQIVGLTAKSPNKVVKLTNVDDFLHAIRTPKGIDDTVLGLFNQGLLKSSKTPAELIDGITKEVVKTTKFKNRYAKLTDSEMKKALKSAGYSDGAVDSFMKNAKKDANFKKAFTKAKQKRSQNGKNKNMSPKSNGSNVNPQQKKTLAERGRELLNMITVKKMSWKQLLAWGAGIGVGALALWWYLFDNDIVVPDDTPETEPGDTGEWAACIKELLDSKEARITTFGASGLVGVSLVTAEYPEGLNFFSNGRVGDVKTKKKGSWKCKGTKAVIDSPYKTVVAEQGDATTAIEVKKMIRLLDFPVKGSDLIKAGNLLQKYVNNGKGKDFLSLYQQSGFGNGDLSKTLDYITTIEPSSVQAKNRLKKLISQILSGKVNEAESKIMSLTRLVLNEQGGKIGLSKIDIKWDGEAGTPETPPKAGGTGGGVSYKDCSSKDFPFEFGCISPKIAEIQGCLGITPQKGYFGPKTKRTMEPTYDLSGGITKEIYDAVKAKCGGAEAEVKPERERYTDAETLPIYRPKIDRIDTGKLGDLSGKIKPISGGNPGESIYKMLQSNYGDGSNPQFPYIFSEGPRLKYKGEFMGGNAKDQLSQYVATLGYREEPIKDKDKSYGVKYVWVKE